MERETKEYFGKKRFWALVLVITIIANMFSPYGMLFNTSYASNLPPDGKPYFELAIHPVNKNLTVDDEEWDDDTGMYFYDYCADKPLNPADTPEENKTRIISIDLKIRRDVNVAEGTIRLNYDSSILKPTVEDTTGSGKNKKTFMTEATTIEDFMTKPKGQGWDTPSVENLDTGSSLIVIGGAQKPDSVTDTEYFAGDNYIVATLQFMLADGLTIDDIPTSAFSLDTSSSLVQGGLEINYFPAGKNTKLETVNGIDYLAFSGFKSSTTKTITSITLDTNMDKTKYYVGEDLDFTGASITITYDNGDTETITDINKAVTDGLITIDETKASANKKVVITAGEETCDIPYNIVTGISVAQNPTETEYEHGDTIDLTGGKVTVTYDNGDTEEIDMTSSLLTSTPTKADVNNGVVTLVYKDGTSTATVPLTITDPVVSITITNNPNNVEYDDTDPIDFTGGTIKATKKSGAEITGISMTDSAVTKSATNADINSCTDKTTNSSTGLPVGKQTITVTYEGKSDTFDILVNDTISTIAVKNQPTAKNKYGTAGSSLNLTGATLEITTGSGQTLTTPINVGMLDLSGYSSTSLTAQNLPVTYAGKTTTAGNGINITLKDYITGITVTSANDVTTIYDNELTAGDLTGVTYVKNYESGATSTTQIPVTLNMISGYNKKPSASTFDNNHISTQTVTVTLNTADDSDIDIIPVTDNLTIKVKDKVTGITVSNRPNTTTFNYNGTFSAMGGRIKRTYASGALDSGNGVSMTDSSITITETDGTNINMTPAASEFINGKVTKTLKVTYTDETGTYNTELTNIIIKDIFKEMAIKTDATKKFNHGDIFSTGNGQLTLTYESGATRDIDTDDGTTITETVGGGLVNMSPQATDYTNNTLTKNITVSYTEGTVTDTVNYDITIINDVKEITVHTKPKDEYNINDNLDITGGEIQVRRAVGPESIISMTDAKVSVTGFNSATENTSLPLTVSYEENGITKTTTYNVTVKDSVTSIEVKNPPTTVKYGEELDLSGTTIDIVKGSGNSNTAVLSSMISTFDKNILGEQTVTVTYGGQTDTFKVRVQDYVTGITINPDTVTGKYNDTLTDIITANSIKYTVTYASAGQQTPVDLVDTMVAGYNATSTTTQNLTVTYTDTNTELYAGANSAQATLNITLSNVVTGITITAPTKTKYNHGESIDLTGGKIDLVYADGTTGTEPIASATIKEADGSEVNMSPVSYDSTNKVSKTLVITYTKDGERGTVNYPIEIINDVRSITVHSTNHKTEYNVNDTLDLANLEILVTRATGTDEVISDTSKFTVTGFKADKEYTQLPLTVSYTENGITKTTDYKINVKDSVTSIETQNPPTVLQYGKELDLSNTTISITGGSNNGKSIPVTDSMVSYDKTAIGEVTVTVTYGKDADGNDVTDTFNITVKDYVTGITINETEVEGTKGKPLSDLISDNSLEYTVTYAKAGAKTPVALAEAMVSGYVPEATADQNLTITYTDNDVNSFTKGDPFTATLKVKFQNTVTGITITAPTKTKYNHGESIDLTLENINLTYANGTTGTLPLSSATITEADGTTPYSMSPASYGSTNKVNKTLKITYTEDGVTGTVDYPIEIINDVKSITVHSTNHKTEYNVNDTLDITNLEISVKRAVGADEVISDTSKFTVTGFKADKEYTQLPLTVSYEENGITKTTTYNVTVKDSVTSIEVKNPPTELKYGEDLDLTNTTISITGGSNNGKSIPVTEDMISYDKTAIGEIEVTVTYGKDADGNDVTDTFNITVKDYVTGITINPDTVSGTYNDTLADIISNNTIKYTVTYAKAGASTPVDLSDAMVLGYNPTSTEAQSLTVKYTDNDENSSTKGDTFTTTLNITLSDKITGVTVSGSAVNTAYNHGETLDFTGISIYEQHASDAQDSKGTPVSIENAVITDITDGEAGAPNATTNLPANVFATNNTQTRKIRVQYTSNGYEDHVDFDITVKNILDHIEIATSPKTSYEKGDLIENAGGTIKIYRKADKVNSTETINITDDMITGLDTKEVGQDFTATVTYKEEDIHGNKIVETDTYQYNVVETVQSITLNPGPDKTTYKYGENIDLTGAYLDIVKGNGTTDRVAVTENMISGFDSTPNANDLPETQNITVTYGKLADGTPATVTFTVTVEDEVTGIILTPPDKTTYKYGEELDLSTGFVQKVMASGASTKKVPLTDNSVEVTGFDPKKLGPQTITVKYEGETKTFPVIVEENVISIKIVDYPKQNYEYGEKLDTTGGTIEITRANGDKEIIPITKEMVTGFDPNQVGPQKLTVTYGGQKDFYDIEVTDDIAGIKITPPKKLVYNIGEKIDLTGGKVTEITSSGNTKTPVDMTLDMITGFNTSSEGAKTITVTYKGYKATFNIIVVDPLSDIQIVTLPNKLTYKYGEKLDVTGGTIQTTTLSGEKQTVEMTPDMITGYNPNKLGQQTLKVTYEGITKEFIVTVEDYVTKLIVKAPDKTQYEYGQDLNLAGGKVSIIMASGAVEENVEMTASMLTGYNKTKEGLQTIKVEYKGLQGTFQVKVIDKIKGISMNTLPNKTDYKNGENLDLTGGTITVVKSSGTQTITITKDMIKGYDSKKAGQQVITVSYGGFTTEFVVTVAKKTSTKPSRPSIKPAPKPVEPPIIQEPIIEEPIIEEPITPIDPPVIETPKVDEPIIEKPTEVLGVKDEQNNNSGKILAGCIGGIGLLFLLILIVFKRNVEVYVFEDGEFVLGGKDKITKKNPRIDIDKFLDEGTYPNQVKVRLSELISEKLDGKEIEINHRGKTIKHTIKYNNEEYEIILK